MRDYGRTPLGSSRRPLIRRPGNFISSSTIEVETSKSSNDDAQVLRLQSENSSLLRKLDSLRFERDAEHSKLSEQIKQLGRQKESSQQEVNEMRTRIQKFADYDEIKRELEVATMTLQDLELTLQQWESMAVETSDRPILSAHCTHVADNYFLP